MLYFSFSDNDDDLDHLRRTDNFSMPTVNVYLAEQYVQTGFPAWDEIMRPLKEFIAKELTCKERVLRSDEVSVRLMNVHGKGTIAAVEIEIQAHAYSERVARCDEICRDVGSFVMNNINKSQRKYRSLSDKDVRVWLMLSEVGHSWTE